MLKSLLIPKICPFRLLLLGSASCAVGVIFVFSPPVFILSASSGDVSKSDLHTKATFKESIFPSIYSVCFSGDFSAITWLQDFHRAGQSKSWAWGFAERFLGAQGLCCLCVGSDSVLCAEDRGVEEASICSLYSLLC